MRQYALGYSKNLPDFICTQVTRRYAAAKPGSRYGGRTGSDPSWMKQDELTIRLSYFDQKENYKLILVNSTPATQEYANLGAVHVLRGDFAQYAQRRFSEPSSLGPLSNGSLGARVSGPSASWLFHLLDYPSRSQLSLIVKDQHLDIVHRATTA